MKVSQLLGGSNHRRGKAIALTSSCLLLGACTTTPSASTATTVPVEATFGTLKLWSVTSSVDGLYSVVYLDPYWLVYNQQNTASTWRLKMPTNISSRRGVALATNPSGVKALGFIPYGAQKNTTIFEYGPNGAYAPSFFSGSLLTSNQALTYGGGGLFALADVGGKVAVEEQTSAGGPFSQVTAFPFFATNGSIGFEGNYGVAIYLTTGGQVEESSTNDGGATWSTPVSLSTSGSVVQIFVATTVPTGAFSTPAATSVPNFAVVASSSGGGYTTTFYGGGSRPSTITTPTPPILGTSATASILEVDGAIGGNLSFRTFSQGVLSLASSVQGVHGAVEAIYGDGSKTTIIASTNGVPVSYSTESGSVNFGSPLSFDVSALNG